MARKERLPKYVSSFVDNRGKRRYRFRRAGCPGGYFEAHPNSKAGKAEYDAFAAGLDPSTVKARPVVPGSLDALLALYYESTDYRGNAGEVSLAKRRAILERFRAKHGHRLVKDARYDKLDAYIAEIAAGYVNDDGEQLGGPFAAESARKLLRGLFRYSVKIKWRADNPIDYVSFRPKKTKGYHSWSEAEIAQYREHWKLGTKQRLALELMLWTGKRRGDAVFMGPQHIRANGDLFGRDKKTDKPWELPIAPQLREAIDAMTEANHLCFVPSDRGRAYSPASFGNMFRKWCDAAGLPHCSAHGLRKAISRRMAEQEVNNAGIKAVTLHSRDDEVAIYTAAAEQRKLARASITKISEWEVSSATEDARQSTKGKSAK